MKTTIDVDDGLLVRAKRKAARSGTTLRQLVEEGLRRVLADEAVTVPFKLVDRSVGSRGGPNPLADIDWTALREEIHRR